VINNQRKINKFKIGNKRKRNLSFEIQPIIKKIKLEETNLYWENNIINNKEMKDLRSLMLVCNKFYKIIKNENSFWEFGIMYHFGTDLLFTFEVEHTININYYKQLCIIENNICKVCKRLLINKYPEHIESIYNYKYCRNCNEIFHLNCFIKHMEILQVDSNNRINNDNNDFQHVRCNNCESLFCKSINTLFTKQNYIGWLSKSYKKPDYLCSLCAYFENDSHSICKKQLFDLMFCNYCQQLICLCNNWNCKHCNLLFCDDCITNCSICDSYCCLECDNNIEIDNSLCQ